MKTQLNKMKQLIAKEILSYKMRKDSNPKVVKKLQQMLDKETITRKDFLSLSYMIPIEDFFERNPNTDINLIDSRCKDVISYIGGNFIQMLSDGGYKLSYNDNGTSVETETNDIDLLEKLLFEYIRDGNK